MSHSTSVITQDGDSALIVAARKGDTKVVSLLVKAGAALDLQNKVNEVAAGTMASSICEGSSLIHNAKKTHTIHHCVDQYMRRMVT